MRGARYLSYGQTTSIGRGFVGHERRYSSAPRACDVVADQRAMAALAAEMAPRVSDDIIGQVELVLAPVAVANAMAGSTAEAV